MLGKPNALKQVNLSLVRRALKESGSATRAELVKATNISVTTVRTLLSEMLADYEIAEGGFDESIGGRKAVRYRLCKDCFFGAALCLEDTSVRYLIVNICGEICEKGSFAAADNVSRAVCSFLDGLFATMEIRSIGIGVPGVVNGLSYQKKNADGEMESHPIGVLISQRYGVPVILENDLNAITLGFGQCYLKQFPEECRENIHMAYVSFDADCISAGFISGGRILRGRNNWAGELGEFPIGEGETLNDRLAYPLGESQYSHTVARLLAGICCVLNPQYIAVGGASFRRDCLALIAEYLNDMLPHRMTAEILYAKDSLHDYMEGMAHLTAEQIFAEVKLVEE